MKHAHRVICLAAVMLGPCELDPPRGFVLFDRTISDTLHQGDTVRLTAWVGLAGDSLPGDIRYRVDAGSGLTVEPTTGLVMAVRDDGRWFVMAESTSPRASGSIGFTVPVAPDLVVRLGDSVLTALDSADSAPMSVKVWNVVDRVGDPLSRIDVRFVVTYLVAAGLRLAPSTGHVGTTGLDSNLVSTNPEGVAAAVVRATGTVPDSAVVLAHVARRPGHPVDGSPVRFTIRFQ